MRKSGIEKTEGVNKNAGGFGSSLAPVKT